MRKPLRIAVVGYGIAGAATAFLLRRQGNLVEVFERLGRDASAGAGILLHPPAVGMLAAFGVQQRALALGARVSRIRGQTVRSRQLMDFRYGDGESARFGLGMQRQALLALLRQADPACGDVRFDSAVRQADTEHGFLWLENGTQFGPFDLIVAADGAGSALRRSRAGNVVRDKPYPSAAIVCLLDDQDGLSDDVVWQRFSTTRHVSLWPVGSQCESAPRRANISINVPLEHAAQWLRMGEWRRAVSEIWPVLGDLLEHQGEAASPLLYSYRDVVVRQFRTGRLVLIGDAAHSMSPQLGMGAALALEDALALAQALASGADALTAANAFGRLRRRAAGQHQRICRWLTPAFQSETALLAHLRDQFASSILDRPIVQKQIRKHLTAGLALRPRQPAGR